MTCRGARITFALEPATGADSGDATRPPDDRHLKSYDPRHRRQMPGGFQDHHRRALGVLRQLLKPRLELFQALGGVDNLKMRTLWPVLGKKCLPFPGLLRHVQTNKRDHK